MLKSMFIGKNFLRIVLAGWIIGSPYTGSQAMEDPEKNLKRPHDDSCIEESHLKKQKVDPEAEIMDVIEVPEDLSQETTPLVYTNDILRTIASFLDFHSYQAFRCINKGSSGALNDGWGLVYEHRFDRPEIYVTNILTQFPMLQLGLILNQSVRGVENIEKVADFICSLLKDQFANRVCMLHILVESIPFDNPKLINIINCIIEKNIVNLKTLMTNDRLFPYLGKSRLVKMLESQTLLNVKSLCLVNSLNQTESNESFINLIKDSKSLNNLSFNDDLHHHLDSQLFFSSDFFEKFPKALACNHSLTTLNFQGCHFELAQVPSILSMMEHANATLTTLILDDNLFGFEGIGMILAKNQELSLAKNKSLKNMSFKSMTYSGGVENDSILENFINSLKTESSLISLSLSVQLIDFSRSFPLIQQILQALSINRTLEKLCLFSIPFHENDKKNLTDFFRTNTSLKRLELPNCFANIGPRNYFTDAFKENTTIQELILDDQTKTYFGENNMGQIKDILHRNLLIHIEQKMPYSSSPPLPNLMI